MAGIAEFTFLICCLDLDYLSGRCDCSNYMETKFNLFYYYLYPLCMCRVFVQSPVGDGTHNLLIIDEMLFCVDRSCGDTCYC